MARSFEAKHAALVERLEDPRKRLASRLLGQIHQLLQYNPAQPAAWTLHHRAVCLNGGSMQESDVLIADAARRLGADCSATTRIEMLNDSAISLVCRAYALDGDQRPLQLATQRIDEAQSYMSDAMPDPRNWHARLICTRARIMCVRSPKMALGLHNQAQVIWNELESKANGRWAVTNLIFQLYAATAINDKATQEATSRELQKRSPNAWGYYAVPLLLNGTDGAWFKPQVIRF